MCEFVLDMEFDLRAPSQCGCAIQPAGDIDFQNWVKTNVHPHKMPGYSIATISLKPIGQTPGDCSADQMEAIADMMDALGQSEIRVTHEQNLVLPHKSLVGRFV